MEFDKEILKGYVDTIIVSVLLKEDLYGYEIAKRIKEMSRINFEMKETTLYVSLKRLEKKGYLIGYWNDNEGTGGGRRRYYHVSDEGKSFFKDRVSEWKNLKLFLSSFMEEICDEENR